MSDDLRLTRRAVMVQGIVVATGAIAAGTLLGCGGGGGGGEPLQDFVVSKAYMLSGRGLRTSKAAQLHNHNKVFPTPEAAEVGRAHAGDTSRVVPIDVKPDTWLNWFARGIHTTPRPDDQITLAALPPSQVRMSADLRDPTNRGIHTTPGPS